MAVYKVDGPALKMTLPGITQAASYCLHHGVSYASVTNGITWIAFLPFPGPGVSYLEGKAIVFPGHKAILDNFAEFYDLFSRQNVAQKIYNLHFAKAGGLTAQTFEPMIAANKNEYVRLVPSSELASDLEPIFREFFGSLSGDNDPETLTECFVETRESRYADASLEKLVRSISSTISALDPTSNNQLAREIRDAVDSGRGGNRRYRGQ